MGVNSWALEDAPSFPGSDPALPAPSFPSEATAPLVEALRRHRVLICTPLRSRQRGDNYSRKVDELRVRLREQVLPLSSVPQPYDDDHAALASSARPELTDDAKSGFPGLLVDERHLPITRDRLFRCWYERTEAEWLLWWDDDTWCEQPHVALTCMLMCAVAHDVHVLGAMYPRKQRNEKRIVEAALRGEEHPLEHGFTLEDMRILRPPSYKGVTSPSPWMLPVAGVGMGFMLVSRRCAQVMYERERHTFWNDRVLGGRTPGFHRDLHDPEEAYGEDYAFCIRATASGFPVYAYMGPEAPFFHDGTETFKAHPKTMMVAPTVEEVRNR